MTTPNKLDRSILISTTWAFILFNMIYADIIGMLRPGYLELLDTMSKTLSVSTVMVFSVLLEIPIALVLLSRVLRRGPNRIVNFIGVPITIPFVIFGGLGGAPLSYFFFAGIEIIAMLMILYLAIRWPREDA